MKLLFSKDFPLSDVGCDRASEAVGGVLTKSNICSSREILRLRLSLEDAVVYWKLHGFPEDSFTVTVVEKGLLRKKLSITVTLHTRGDERIDPLLADDGTDDIGRYIPVLSGVWTYKFTGGENSVSVEVTKGKKLSLGVPISILLGIVAVFVLKSFPSDTSDFIMSSYVNPVFDIYLGILRACVAPLIFLSVLTGILSFGSVSGFGKIGKRLLSSFATVLAVVCAVGIVPIALFLTADGSAGEGFSGGGLWSVVADVLPKDLITPFTQSNSMQIAILGLAFGLVLLPFHKKIPTLGSVLNELYNAFSKLIKLVTSLLPVFAFICVLRIGFIENIFALKKLALWMLVGILFMGVAVVAVALFTAIRKKLPVIKTMLSLSELWLLSFLTASSAACMQKIRETAEDTFGIDRHNTDLGVPLGLILLKPGSALNIMYMTAGCMAVEGKFFSPATLGVLFLMAFILSISCPPVPGGVITCYALMFDRFGISTTLLAAVSSLNTVADSAETGCNTTVLACTLARSEPRKKR